MPRRRNDGHDILIAVIAVEAVIAVFCAGRIPMLHIAFIRMGAGTDFIDLDITVTVSGTEDTI